MRHFRRPGSSPDMPGETLDFASSSRHDVCGPAIVGVDGLASGGKPWTGWRRRREPHPLDLTSEEGYSIRSLRVRTSFPEKPTVRVEADGQSFEFTKTAQIDTSPGGVLPPGGSCITSCPSAAGGPIQAGGDVRCRPWLSTDWEESAERR